MTDRQARAEGPKILIVDDSKTIRRTAEALLEQSGYRVLCAADGFQALALIAEERPDLILLDVMMPRLDGYQTCALIKHNPQLHHTPVGMLTRKDGLFDRSRGRMAGSDEYLTKPFTREELLGAVERHLPRHRQPPVVTSHPGVDR